MSSTALREIRTEAELLHRFADSYRVKFEAMIDQLNHTPASTAAQSEQCMRLCVETIHMLLATQSRLVDALSNIPTVPSRA
jgi:hypothetical protein